MASIDISFELARIYYIPGVFSSFVRHFLRGLWFRTGAIALVSSTLLHRLSKRNGGSVSHFTTTINDIEVLRRPATVSLTPAKSKIQHMFRKRAQPDSDEPGPNTKRACKTKTN